MVVFYPEKLFIKILRNSQVQEMIIPAQLKRGETGDCPECGKTFLLSTYKGDTLFGKRLSILKNECWKLCSGCGCIVRR